jgi:hypothetical protein
MANASLRAASFKLLRSIVSRNRPNVSLGPSASAEPHAAALAQASASPNRAT